MGKAKVRETNFQGEMDALINLWPLCACGDTRLSFDVGQSWHVTAIYIYIARSYVNMNTIGIQITEH